MIRPEDIGTVGTADDTTVIQAAVNAAMAQGEILWLEGFYNVSTISIASANRFVVKGDGVLRGIGPLCGKTCVLEVLNGVAVKIDGLNIDASYNFAYESAFKHWSDQPAGAFNVCTYSINCMNAKLGVQFGDAAYPDLAISENTLHHGFFYGCAQGIKVVGSQAVLYVDHFQNITSPNNWSAVERAGIIVQGGTVHVVGGSLQNAADAEYSAIVNKAFVSPAYADTYGRVDLSAVSIETPGRIMRSENVVGGVAAANGRLSMRQCGGYIGSDAHNLIELDSQFNGRIEIDETNSFFSDIVRTKKNVVAGPMADITVSDKAFRGGLKQGKAGISGGMYRHDAKLVLDAKNTNNQPFGPGSWAKLSYAEYDPSSPFDGSVYTVPAGGHGLTTVLFVAPTNVPVAELAIRLNGNEVTNSRIAYAGQLVCNFPNLNAGDQISTWIVGINGSGCVGGGIRDKLQIVACT